MEDVNIVNFIIDFSFSFLYIYFSFSFIYIYKVAYKLYL